MFDVLDSDWAVGPVSAPPISSESEPTSGWAESPAANGTGPQETLLLENPRTALQDTAAAQPQESEEVNLTASANFLLFIYFM